MKHHLDRIGINRYKGLVDHSPMGYFLCRVVVDDEDHPLDYEFLEVNRAFEKLVGLPEKEIIGKRRSEVFTETPEGFHYWLNTYAGVALGGGDKEIKEYSHTLGGYYREYVYSPQKYYFAVLITDITREMKETEDKTLILKALNEIIFELDEDFVFTQIIAAEEDKLFYPREKILGASIKILFEEDLVETFINHLEMVRQTGNKTEMVYPSIVAGSDQWFRATFDYLVSEAGNRYLIQITDITEKKRLQDEVAERNHQIEEFFSVNIDLLCIVDPEGRFVRVNRAWEDVLGYRVEELEGASIFDFIHPWDCKKTQEAQKSLAEGNEVTSFVNRYRRKDGGYSHMEWRSKQSKNLVYAAARDISGRIRLEEELQSTNERLTEIALHSRTFAWEVDQSGTYTYVNPSVKNVLGYEPEEIVVSYFYDYNPEDRRGEFRDSVLEVFRRQEVIESLANPVITREGEVLWVSTSAYPIFEEDGTLKGYRGSDTDINETYLNQRALENREEFLSKILKTTQEGFWMVNTEGRIEMANEAYSRMTGYSLAELNQMAINDLEAEENPEETRGRIEKILKDGSDRFESRHQRKDGSIFDVEVTINMMGGENPTFICFCRDITEAKRAKQILHNERELFKTTLFSVGDGVISTDREGRVVVINEVASQLTGWSPEEAVGRSLDEVFNLINEHTLETIENPAREAIKTGRTFELESHTLLISKGGFKIAIEDSAAPIKDLEGNITGAVIVFRDFTQKKEKQRQVEYLSFHDYLTGLYNRRYLEDAMVRLDTSRNLPFTLMVMDVNGLKLINDAFGHDAGDQLLKTVALTLKQSTRSDDIVARTGGDEFVILLPNTDDEGARRMRDRIVEATGNAGFESVIVSVAIGWATKRQEEEDIFEIQKTADDRMFENKLKYGRSMRSRTIDTVLRNIHNRYDRENIHSDRVAELAEQMGRALGLNERETKELRTVGAIHDIGKIMIPPEIINKTGELTQEEYDQIKRHSEIGYQILKGVAEYREMAEIVLNHHEHYNGEGYPQGQKGREIPLNSRIIAIVDAYEAMTSYRSYKKTVSHEEAVEELRRCKGTMFDPDLVEIFIESVLGRESNKKT